MTIRRRTFLKGTVGFTTAAMSAAQRRTGATGRESAVCDGKKVRVGVIGCGSVSTHYLSHLKIPHVELVSVCDRIFERAEKAGAEHEVPHQYAHIREMLAGAPFDLLVNLTDIQSHYELNKLGLEAGRHVWSEEPMAGTYEEGKHLLKLANARRLRIWAAPTVVLSPQFRFMAETISNGKLGAVASARGTYGHLGPDWAAFFYEEGAGSLADLAVYDLTALTGLLGPAREVIAATTIITPVREIKRDKKVVQVEAEDNAMVTMYHDGGALSHVQSGFNYHASFRHDYTGQGHHTIDIFGREGRIQLAGYSWAPHSVDLALRGKHELKRFADEPSDYVWENGASHMAKCLATEAELPLTAEHALHVVEILEAARESQRTGRRIKLKSRFNWPIFT
ncbi:Gfo/Idh/MocA family oxidoreductase [Acidobacteria bacterium AH-259-G07]|nr:Gfo/Idh/MocA family oxidoreductase [Acidobacteria bacterium AH-259-G07]